MDGIVSHKQFHQRVQMKFNLAPSGLVDGMGVQPKPLKDDLSPVLLSKNGFHPLELSSSGEMPMEVDAGLTPLRLASYGQREIILHLGDEGRKERPIGGRPGEKELLIYSEELSPIILIPNPGNISVIVFEKKEPGVTGLKE